MTVLRTSACVIALNAMVAAPSMTAQAADTTLTLACKGTESSDASKRSEVLNVGVIIDLEKKTVVGLSDSPLIIDTVTETAITFGRHEGTWYMDGSLDRVTGQLFALLTRVITKVTLTYDLKCKAAQRMY
jgi:hypothetical protein